MCEFTDSEHLNQALNYFRGRPPSDLINQFIISRFPYAFQKAQCPICGNYLYSYERRPRGRATRSMCETCYEELIANRINRNCFVCGRSLDERKIRKQKGNPREIQYHLDDGYCINAWTIIHNVVVGKPERDSRPRQASLSIHKLELKQLGFLSSPADYPQPFQNDLPDRTIKSDQYSDLLSLIKSQPNTYKGKPIKFIE